MMKSTKKSKKAEKRRLVKEREAAKQRVLRALMEGSTSIATDRRSPSPSRSPPAVSEILCPTLSPDSRPSLPGMGKSRPAALEAAKVENLNANLEKLSIQDTRPFCYSEGLGIYPILSPRFPKQGETLSLDNGFDQTPILKKILAHYSDDYVPSARHIVSHPLRPDSGLRLNLRDVYSRVASSVVAVSSFFGVERKVDCSGFIVGWSPSEMEGTIVTSAKVLCSPLDSDYEFHVIVRMADGTLFLAKEDHVDFYNNILTLKVKSKVELPVLDLRGATGLVVKRVVSLGRAFYGYSLLDFVGELDQEYPRFGCSELLRSSCYASQICEGGPTITDTGDVVGITFFGNGACAHVLPAHIISSCLERWKSSSSTIMRPWFGFSVLDLKQVHFQTCEKLHLSHRDSHVLVYEVFEGSFAHRNHVRSHDLIVRLNGTKITSADQYSDLLSRGVIDSSSDSDRSFVVSIHRLGRDIITFPAEYLSVDDRRFYDCWPQLDGKEWCVGKIGSQKNPLGVLDLKVPHTLPADDEAAD